MRNPRLSRPFIFLIIPTLLGYVHANRDFVPCDLPDDVNVQLNRVEWITGMFVAVGAEGTVLYSEDGDQWRRKNVPVNGDLLGVAKGSGPFDVIVAGKKGSQGVLFMTDLSDSTAAWMNLIESYSAPDSPGFYNMASAQSPDYPEFHIAVGVSGTVHFSVDPYLQVPVPTKELPAGQDLLGVAMSLDGSFFVAAGEEGTIIAGGTEERNHHPVALLPFPSDTNACFYSVKRVESRYYLCNLNGGRAGLAILDSNQNLQPVTMPDSLGVADITHNSAGFFAVSHNSEGLILHSPDAEHWEVVDTVSPQTQLRGIASKPESDFMIVVGHDGALFRSSHVSPAKPVSWRAASGNLIIRKHTKGLSRTIPHFLIDNKFDAKGRRIPKKVMMKRHISNLPPGP